MYETHWSFNICNICMYIYVYLLLSDISLLVNFSTAREGIVMFSRYFKQFGILVHITIKVPICSNRGKKDFQVESGLFQARIGPKKVPILPESLFFFPYCNIIQHKVLMAKFWKASTVYGSFNRGREKWPKCGMFFSEKIEALL